MTENFTWLLGMPMNKKIMIIVHSKLRQKQNLKKNCLPEYFSFSLCNRNRSDTSACRLNKKKGHTIATESLHSSDTNIEIIHDIHQQLPSETPGPLVSFQKQMDLPSEEWPLTTEEEEELTHWTGDYQPCAHLEDLKWKKKWINLHTAIEVGDKDHIKKKLVIDMHWYNVSL